MIHPDGPLDSLAFTAGILDDRDQADGHSAALLDVLRERAAQLEHVRTCAAESRAGGVDVPRSEVAARLPAALGGVWSGPGQS